MILVTGSNGFIGGALVRRLKSMNVQYTGVDYHIGPGIIHPNDYQKWWGNNFWKVKGVIHLGANTDTVEKDWEKFREDNLEFSKVVWLNCNVDSVPLIYASSAATYGNGSLGYSDSHDLIKDLKPLNEYARSKNEFDKWVLDQENCPSFWSGLKFFNVYGFNESHKGRMASMIWNGYNQIKETTSIRLFKYGHHMRDFVYVEDVVDVILWMLLNKPECGIYNVGTGDSRSFNQMANILFEALEIRPQIRYIDMPEDLTGQYQDYTKADITKLREKGYKQEFTSLEEGIRKYISILETL